MATIIKRPYGFQLRVSHRLLPKDLWATFDTREAAEQYGRQLEGLLAQGIVPAALLERDQPKNEIWTVHRCIAEYLKHNSVPLSDQKLLKAVMPSVQKISTGSLNYEWAEGWVCDMKRKNRLAPGTIRHRHGALARCFDWMLRKHPEIMAQNPLRLLRRGFATYTNADTELLARQGLEPRVDEERDRRLSPDEERRIRARLHGRQEELLLFDLALQTAMRMRECYTLQVSQINLLQRTIFLERTKNGSLRQVPLPTPMVQILSTYIEEHRTTIRARQGRLFSFWSGDHGQEILAATTAALSARFARIFMLSGVPATFLAYNDPGYRPPTPADVRAVVELLDLTADQVAALVGMKDGRAVRRWLASLDSKTHAQIDYQPTALDLAELANRPVKNTVEKGRGKEQGKASSALATRQPGTSADRQPAAPPHIGPTLKESPAPNAELVAKASAFEKDKPSFVLKNHPELAPAYGVVDVARKFAEAHLPKEAREEFVGLARRHVIQKIIMGESVKGPRIYVEHAKSRKEADQMSAVAKETIDQGKGPRTKEVAKER